MSKPLEEAARSVLAYMGEINTHLPMDERIAIHFRWREGTTAERAIRLFSDLRMALEGHARCSGCDSEIDPSTCGCGESLAAHGIDTHPAHGARPMGCNCGREPADARAGAVVSGYTPTRECVIRKAHAEGRVATVEERADLLALLDASRRETAEVHAALVALTGDVEEHECGDERAAVRQDAEDKANWDRRRT